MTLSRAYTLFNDYQQLLISKPSLDLNLISFKSSGDIFGPAPSFNLLRRNNVNKKDKREIRL
jgi:hypothetical protein